MDLVHHLVVAELLRERLLWGAEVRAQTVLGARAPDAHSFAPEMGREPLHPAPGEDHAAFVLGALEPEDCLERPAARAFAVSCVAHLVADEITRERKYHLPPHAPPGFVPLADFARPAPGSCIDAQAISRSLMRAPVTCWLRPLTPEMIDRKRWEVLGRPPLDQGSGVFVVVEPLATVAQHCADEALIRLRGSGDGVLLLGGG